MLSPCSPRMSALTCDGRGRQLLRDQAAKANRVELGAQAKHLCRRQIEPIGRHISQNIDRIADDQNDGVFLEPGFGNFASGLQKQIDVAIDQVQPRFIRLAPQPRRDADNVARRNVLVAAGGDDLVGRAGPAVQQIERLPLSQFADSRRAARSRARRRRIAAQSRRWSQPIRRRR